MPVTNEGLAAKLDALEEKLEDQFAAHHREHMQHDAAHGREHEFTSEALKVAAALAKENKSDANEWRSTMNDREARFSTKDDTKTILMRLDNIERAGLVSQERERTEKELAAARTTRNMWMVGLMAGVGAVLVNAVLRLSGN